MPDENRKYDVTPGQTAAVYTATTALLLLALFFSIDWTWDFNPKHYRIGLDHRDMFAFLAIVPGILGFVYHLVTVRQRRKQNMAGLQKYYDYRRAHPRPHEDGVDLVPDVAPGPVSALCASGLLTAVFLFAAIVSGYTRQDAALTGLEYSAIGAYISVLYYMVGRIYASALSSRFLMTSALRSASAIALGYAIGAIGVTQVFGTTTTANLSLLLVGLFHNWAIDSLRSRARKLFGQSEPQTAELPLAIVDGVDDISADLLTEYGISSVQHLATAEPGDVCERTLLPFDRILDWIDQAILISYLRSNIAGARSLAIRGAVNLAVLHVESNGDLATDKGKLLVSLAEKASMPAAAVEQRARELRDSYMVRLIYKLREGKDFPDSVSTLVPRVVTAIAEDYDFIGAAAATPQQFQIRKRP